MTKHIIYHDLIENSYFIVSQPLHEPVSEPLNYRSYRVYSSLALAKLEVLCLKSLSSKLKEEFNAPSVSRSQKTVLGVIS